jgi:DNA-binding MarR family transcriptional regulator
MVHADREPLRAAIGRNSLACRDPRIGMPLDGGMKCGDICILVGIRKAGPPYCKEIEAMTIAQSHTIRATLKEELNTRAWKMRKRTAGLHGTERKFRLNKPLHERPGYLLWRARHIADSIYAHECRDFGITSSQYVVLVVVKETPGTDQVSVSRIAGLDRFTTALVLTNLIKRKLIVRERSTSDRRRYSLRPSTQGLELLKRIQPSLARARAHLLSPFTLREQRVFISTLQKLVTTLNDDARAPVDEDALPNARRKLDRSAKRGRS